MTQDKLGALEPRPQRLHVHREVAGLKEVRQVAIVARRRHARAAVEAVDRRLTARLAQHVPCVALEREKPVAAGDAEFDGGNARKAESLS